MPYRFPPFFDLFESTTETCGGTSRTILVQAVQVVQNVQAVQMADAEPERIVRGGMSLVSDYFFGLSFKSTSQGQDRQARCAVKPFSVATARAVAPQLRLPQRGLPDATRRGQEIRRIVYAHAVRERARQVR